MKIPRIQKIKYTATGHAYITTGYMKIYLDEVLQLTPHKIINNILYCGIYCVSNSIAILIHISPNGENARVLWQ